MAIHSTANPANVRRSIEKYLIDTFESTNGIPTDVEAGNWWWQGRKIDTSGLDYFLRTRVDRVGQVYSSSVSASATSAGYAVTYVLSIEVYAKRAVYDQTPHILEQTLAMLRNGLARGTAIALKDYEENAGSATTQQYLIVEEPRLPVVAEDGEWLRARWDVGMTTVEQDTTS